MEVIYLLSIDKHNKLIIYPFIQNIDLPEIPTFSSLLCGLSNFISHFTINKNNKGTNQFQSCLNAIALLLNIVND